MKSISAQQGGVVVPEKVGAGLFIVTQDTKKVLLLKRSMASGNPGTWGLPGGNRDEEDGDDLFVTAVREATEEMGCVPPGIRQHGAVLTKRGKNKQKHYTVFMVEVENGDFEPSLNEEHTEFIWTHVKDLPTLGNLHPVVKQIADDYYDFLVTSFDI